VSSFLQCFFFFLLIVFKLIRPEHLIMYSFLFPFIENVFIWIERNYSNFDTINCFVSIWLLQYWELLFIWISSFMNWSKTLTYGFYIWNSFLFFWEGQILALRVSMVENRLLRYVWKLDKLTNFDISFEIDSQLCLTDSACIASKSYYLHANRIIL
jgi:hypothetical protein